MSGFSPQRIGVHVQAWCKRAIQEGATQVPERAITKTRGDARAGDIAILYGPNDKPFGLGLVDPDSPVRVRVLSPTLGVNVDGDWMQNCVQDAVRKRLAIFDERVTNGYRCIHGPGDQLPGLVVDRYANTLVLKVYTAAWFPWLPRIVEGLRAMLGCEAGLLRLSRNLQDYDASFREGTLLWGERAMLATSFLENGLRFEVDPIRGQKTGFFLDQRENRARVESLCDGQDVLNVFCYTGGFSLYAGRGGARSVLSIDASAPAIEALERNIHLNNTAWTQRVEWRFRCGDAFKEMTALTRKAERFGVVVIDPPSFAKKASERETALQSYRRLAALGAELLAPDGHLIFASCSSRIDAEDLEAALCAGARDARRRLEIRARHGHAVDHPISHPDQQYLKCLVAVEP